VPEEVLLPAPEVELPDCGTELEPELPLVLLFVFAL
jgi:hypothetical protein